MKFRIATILIAVSALSTLAGAQTTSDSPAKRGYAERVVAAQQGAEMDRLIQQLAGTAVQPLIANWEPRLEANVPAARQKAAADQLNTELNKFGADAVAIIKSKIAKVSSDTLVAAYMERFSEDELRQLDSFFAAPVIKKYQSLAPELGTLMVGKLVEAARPEIEDRSKVFEEAARKIVGPDKAGAKAAPAAKPKTQP